MYSLKATLLLHFIIAIHVQNKEAKETMYYEPIAEKKAVDSLVEIQAKQTLPLIMLLHLNITNRELWFPKRFEKVFTDEGRIINETRFALDGNQEQMIFCPRENSDEQCLAPTDFQGAEPLECAKEPLAKVEKQSGVSCGENRIGKYFYIFYKICRGFEKLKFLKNEDIDVHQICYDEISQKTIFTSHRILHPELLDSKVLREERNVKYNLTTNDKLTASTIQAQIKEIESQHPDENQDPTKHVYKTQKLIPTEDMALALWKKVTYNYYNVALQHEALIPLWNEINDHIRNQVKKIHSTAEVKIFTGVVDLPSAAKEDGQMSNVWAKLIVAVSFLNGQKRGVVILMNNFIEKGASEPVNLSEQTERTIIDYCDDDQCEDTLTKEFQAVGGRVRCCAANKELEGIFRWYYDKGNTSSSGNNLQLLRIPGINEPVQGNSSDTVQ